MQISIAFDPAKDSADSIAAMVARIYGTGAPVSLTIHPDDKPDAGSDEPAGGEVNPATLDKSGIHWDERIHSKPAKINATDGLYRRRKGVQDTAVASVTAEIKAKLAAGATAAPATPPTPAPIAAPAAPALPTPPGLPTPPPVVAPTPTPYESFVAWIGDHVAKGTMGVNEEWVRQVLESYGVAEGKVVNLQNAAPDLIAAIRTAIAGALNVPAL